MRAVRLLLVALLEASVLAACAHEPTTDITCVSGETRPCDCPDGTLSVQTCWSNEEGWGECDCVIDTDSDSGTDTDSDTDTACFEGDYTIEDASDVAALAPYTCITGGLTITATGLTSAYLPNLASIGEFLYVYDNDALTSLGGLSALTSVDGYLAIIGNDALTSLDWPSGLASLGGGVEVAENTVLTSLDELSAITSLDGMTIFSNPALTSLDLSALTWVDGSLTISDNDSLADVGGLNSLESVGWLLGISDNGSLTNLDGLGALTSIGGLLEINNNQQLPQCEACDLLDQIVDFTGSSEFYGNQADTCSDTCG